MSMLRYLSDATQKELKVTPITLSFLPRTSIPDATQKELKGQPAPHGGLPQPPDATQKELKVQIVRDHVLYCGVMQLRKN